jgi:hypothetical protein
VKIQRNVVLAALNGILAAAMVGVVPGPPTSTIQEPMALIRPNWANITGVVLGLVVLTVGIFVIANGGALWIITSYSSLILVTIGICAIGTFGGYLVNKRKDSERTASSRH